MNIPVNTPLLDGNEKKYLNECIDTGWISSEGPFIKAFEKQFAEKVNRRHGIAVCNGTAALELAVRAVGIKEGDEVIVPTFCIISCIMAIVNVKAIPVFVDCQPDTWNMKVEEIEAKITKKTRAIMVVHTYGLPVDMNPVFELKKKYGLLIIEDAAEMHGQTYHGRPCGSLGDVSIFSFYPNKHITTGEGGMVMTDDDAIAEKCLSLRNLCFVPEKRFVHYELGYNYRMTNLQAALGLAQLERLDEFVLKKRHIGNYYAGRLSRLEGFRFPVPKTAYADNIYWVFAIVIEHERFGDNDAFMKELAAQGIGCRPFFWCAHEQPVFKGKFSGAYKESEYIARHGFYLPSGLGLTDADMDYVCDKFTEIVKRY